MNLFKSLRLWVLTQFTCACTMPIVNSQTPVELPVSLLSESQMSIQSLSGTQTERGLLFTFNTVLFEFDSSTLTAQGYSKINELASVIQRYPQRKIYIEGHTDSIGQAAYNLELSEHRALAVRQALITAGIAAEQLTIRAYGETQPIASNTTAAGRQQNRRVEVLISNEALETKTLQSLTQGPRCAQKLKGPCAQKSGCAL